MTNKAIIYHTLARQYISENPERLTQSEIKKFYSDLDNFINDKEETIADEVYDFLVAKNLIKKQSRHNQFAKYIISKYNPLSTQNTLDIGAGRLCHLSKRLARSQFTMTAMDPNIRITEDESKKANIQIVKKEFYCDDFSPKGLLGTDIKDYDLLIGLEPCDATEHIIRQSLKYDKPFEILLCAAPHKKLTGEMPKNYELWYKYLKSISSEINIDKYDSGFIATNN